MMNKGTNAELSAAKATRYDELVELFLFPEDNLPSPIGELCKKGKKAFYAFFDGVYFEAPTALQVAQKLASRHICK